MQADRDATTTIHETKTANRAPAPTAEALAEHMPLVQRIVAQFMRRLPRSVQREDLVAAGTIGLFQALRSSAHTCPEMFASYARIRIRGSIVDELRRHDWSPRRRRSAGSEPVEAEGSGSVHRLAAVRSTSEGGTESAPGNTTTAAKGAPMLRLASSNPHPHTNTSGSNGTADNTTEAPPESRLRIAVVGFDDLPPQLALAANGIADGEVDSPLDEILERRAFEALHAAVEELPPRERAIIQMRYFEGMASKAIASSLGLSEARISQLHARGVSRLREILAGADELELAA